MSAQSMTPAEFSKDMQRMIKRVEAKTAGNNARDTLMPEMRTIGKMLKDKHKKAIKQHRSVGGKPWEKLYSAPTPRVGDSSGMIFSSGKVVHSKIKITKGKQKKPALAYRKRFGPPTRPMNALQRGGKEKFGVKPTKKILDILSNKVTEGRQSSGSRGWYYGPSWFRYGFTKSTKWIEDLQYGRSATGTGKSRVTGKLPAREIVGLTGGMKRYIESQITKGFMRLLRKDKV